MCSAKPYKSFKSCSTFTISLLGAEETLAGFKIRRNGRIRHWSALPEVLQAKAKLSYSVNDVMEGSLLCGRLNSVHIGMSFCWHHPSSNNTMETFFRTSLQSVEKATWAVPLPMVSIPSEQLINLIIKLSLGKKLFCVPDLCALCVRILHPKRKAFCHAAEIFKLKKTGEFIGRGCGLMLWIRSLPCW